MKRKILGVAALVASAALALSGCGSSTSGEDQSSTESGGTSDSSAEPITIRFSYDQGVGEPTQKLVDAFNASQDEVKVETAVLPQDANVVHDDFVNKLASGDTSVDVMAVDVVFVAEFASAGWLADLGEYFDDQYLGDFLPGPVEGAKYEGTLRALPWFSNASVMFYRQDVLDQLGVEVPSTYQGWQDLADQAKGVSDVEYLASFQASKSEAMVTNWLEFIWNSGGEVFGKDGSFDFPSSSNVTGTETMLNWVQNYAPAGVTTYAEPESEQVFLDGKSLTLRDWSGFWSVGNREGSKVADKIGATVLPVAEEGDTPYSALGGLDLVINDAIDDEHKAAAVKFLEYMTSFDTQKEFTLIAAQPPVIEAVYTDEDVLAEIPFYAQFYDVIKNGRSRPSFPQYAKLSDAIQRNVHDILSGNVEVEQGLNDLQAQAEELK